MRSQRECHCSDNSHAQQLEVDGIGPDTYASECLRRGDVEDVEGL